MERFLSHVEPEPNSGCWLWMAKWDRNGYGQIWNGPHMAKAHRIAYQLFRGEIPPDKEIDHLCRVHNCVNPTHLEVVAHLINVRRGEPARRRLCRRRGHIINGLNNQGHRYCITCKNEVRRKKPIMNCPIHGRCGGCAPARTATATECSRGHPLTLEANGRQRYCRPCRLEYHRQYRRKKLI